MLNTQPLVTIVIIAYNEERFIAEAIESALGQTYSDIEIIVVDDGSKDSTLTIARTYSPRVTAVSQANSGNCSFPRNAGLNLAKGDYISFLDADDILLPNKIATQMALLLQHPEAAFVVNDYCNFRDAIEQPNHFSTCPQLMGEFEKAASSTLLLQPGCGADIMLDENFTIASSPLFKTAAVKALGGFSTELYACEDYHLNYRLASNYPMLVNRELLFKRRLHGANMSSNTLKMSKYYTLSRLHLLADENDKMRRLKLKKIVNRHATNFLRRCIKGRNFKNLRSAAALKLRSIFM